MGRLEISTENKGAVTNYKYPKLFLENGERARVIVGLEPPEVGYVHTLRAPVLANGKPVIEWNEDENTGIKTKQVKLDFVSNPLCLGDEGIVKEKGMDPDHCPMCKLAKDHPDYTEPPKRRMAMHVVRYATKAESFTVADPFQVSVVVWGFTDQVFNKLADFKEEWGPLHKKDLLLGPCTNKGYQKFDISVGNETAYATSAERVALVKRAFANNQIPDLTVALGRAKPMQWIRQDVETVIAGWAAVNGAEAAIEGSTGSLGDDLNDLLGKTAPTAEAAPAVEEKWADPEPDAGPDLLGDVSSLVAEAAASSAAEPAEADDMFGDLLAGGEASAPAPAEDSEPAPKAASAEPKVESFEDLLAAG